MGTGHRKSSAALLIVCERIFSLLGADYSSADQVRTKDDELLKRVLESKLQQRDSVKSSPIKGLSNEENLPQPMANLLR